MFSTASLLLLFPTWWTMALSHCWSWPVSTSPSAEPVVIKVSYGAYSQVTDHRLFLQSSTFGRQIEIEVPSRGVLAKPTVPEESQITTKLHVISLVQFIYPGSSWRFRLFTRPIDSHKNTPFNSFKFSYSPLQSILFYCCDFPGVSPVPWGSMVQSDWQKVPNGVQPSPPMWVRGRAGQTLKKEQTCGV